MNIKIQKKPVLPLSSMALKGRTRLALFPAKLVNTLTLLFMLASVSAAAFMPRSAFAGDLASLDLEQLMNLEVVTAAKAPQAIADAPASITVITAADIKAHGYRHLLDALRSIRGLTSSYDRYTNYLGVRGYTAPGQYNSKVLLLIDGYRTNENIFSGAFLGIDAIIDIDLVDRIEFVPGPGSAIYGDSAFFGVINVITKKASALAGLAVAAETSTHRDDKARFTWGIPAGDSRVSTLFSVSLLHSRGPDIPVLDRAGNTIRRVGGLDGARDLQVFGKLTMDDFSLTLLHGNRRKDQAIGIYGTVQGEPGTVSRDAVSTLSGEWHKKIDATTDVMVRTSIGRYAYDSDYLLEERSGLRYTNVDVQMGEWVDAELQLTKQLSAHRIVSGIDLHIDTKQHQKNFDTDRTFSYLDVTRHRKHLGIYVQDEWRVQPDFSLNSGLRYDHYDGVGSVVNPRVGVVYSPSAPNRIKLLYGRAFRAPNAYERDYASPALGVERNPSLKPEYITTTELVWESYLAAQSRFTALMFVNRVKGLIETTLNAQDFFRYDNVGEVRVQGAQIEYEHTFDHRIRLRASSSLQNVKQTTEAGQFARPVDSPRQLHKLNVSAPLGSSAWMIGVEAQHVGQRLSYADKLPAYTVANLALSTTKPLLGFDITVTAYNVFDRRYADPAVAFFQDKIEQNPREWRVKFVNRF